MLKGILVFFAGVLIVQTRASLPGAGWLILLLACTGLVFCFLRQYRLVRLFCWGMAGLLWAWLQALLLLAQQLPDGLEGEDVLLQGVVMSIPEANPGRSRFLFAIESMQHQGKEVRHPGKVRLSWYRPVEMPAAGQRWQLQVRLRRPHGMGNPGQFDYQGWLFQQGIRATGYVRMGSATQLLAEDSGRYRLQQLRQQVYGVLQTRLDGHPMAGVASALILGERQGISREQWRTFRETGTSHLVAISGLHVGIVAGLAFFLLRRLWPWPLLWPAPKAAAIAALLAAVIYAALAGFSIPTQRALIMVTVAMLALIAQRPVQAVRMLALALLLVLLLDPFAVLAPGFWLSFAAVLFILYGMGMRLGSGGWWWRWGRVQVLVAAGLIPFLVFWFQQVPVTGILANLLAVPWVSMVIVPLLLAGTLLLSFWPVVAGLLLKTAMWSLEILSFWLDACARLLPAEWGDMHAVSWTLLPALAGLIWLLAPRGWPSRWLGLSGLLPMLLMRPALPAPGEVWLHVLDVGQGLAVLVRTHKHVLLYDAGPPFGADNDAGQMVILPVLQHYGIRSIDTLLISHADSDHAGGVEAVLEGVEVKHFFAGAGEVFASRPHEPCGHGQSWEWDGVQFEILHPRLPLDAGTSRNDGSCVLRVVAGGLSAMLTGDIEEAAEYRLLQDVGLDLSSTVLQAPHHGSKTSSTAAFVAATAPRHVIFSTGYRNRWGFPHEDVLARYRAAGSQVHNTASAGAILVKLLPNGKTSVTGWREEAGRYWLDE